jgi:SAM dependent carboxyl methyltransferase
MENQPKPTVAAMEGDGFYNRNSAMQAAGIGRALPVWEKIARSVPVGDDTLVIADYGASQGRNSMAPMRIAISALRAKSGPHRPVQVIHTDLPSNDFGSLFKAIADEPDSYLKGETGIFPSAVGRSYYQPILAPGTVHLGWNSWTLQWLSRKPINVADHVLAGFSADETARMAVRRQAAQDWRDFIVARAGELRPGAKLFCLSAAAQDDRRTWAWLFGELWGAITDLSTSGLLTKQELLRLTVPLDPRTLEDFKAPFAQDGKFAGLAIEHAEVVITPDPFWADFERTGDAESLGRSWAGIWRGVVGPTLAGELDPGRDRGATLDALFSKFATRVAASPNQQQNAIAIVVLRKS